MEASDLRVLDGWLTYIRALGSLSISIMRVTVKSVYYRDSLIGFSQRRIESTHLIHSLCTRRIAAFIRIHLYLSVCVVRTAYKKPDYTEPITYISYPLMKRNRTSRGSTQCYFFAFEIRLEKPENEHGKGNREELLIYLSVE